MRDSRSKEVAVGAMLTVLAVLVLYVSTVLVTAKLSLLGAGSIVVAIAVIELKSRGGLLVYIASSVLGAILVPDKLFVISYICFFGYYPIVKYALERIDKLALEWILKFLLFNMVAVLGYALSDIFLTDQIDLPLPLWALWIPMQVVFAIYDYAMSLAIGHYIGKIRPKFNSEK
jgi:hypothetical protein